MKIKTTNLLLMLLGFLIACSGKSIDLDGGKNSKFEEEAKTREVVPVDVRHGRRLAAGAFSSFANIFSGVGGIATAGSFIYNVIAGERDAQREEEYRQEMLGLMNQMSQQLSDISRTLGDIMQQLVEIQKQVSGLLLDPSLSRIETWGNDYKFLNMNNRDSTRNFAINMVGTGNNGRLQVDMQILHDNVMAMGASPSIIDIDGGVEVYFLIRTRLIQAMQLYMFACMELIGTEHEFECDRMGYTWAQNMDEQLQRVSQDKYSAWARLLGGTASGETSHVGFKFAGVYDSVGASKMLSNPTADEVSVYLKNNDDEWFPEAVISGNMHVVTMDRYGTPEFGGFWERYNGDLGKEQCIDWTTMKFVTRNFDGSDESNWNCLYYAEGMNVLGGNQRFGTAVYLGSSYRDEAEKLSTTNYLGSSYGLQYVVRADMSDTEVPIVGIVDYEASGENAINSRSLYLQVEHTQTMTVTCDVKDAVNSEVGVLSCPKEKSVPLQQNQGRRLLRASSSSNDNPNSKVYTTVTDEASPLSLVHRTTSEMNSLANNMWIFTWAGNNQVVIQFFDANEDRPKQYLTVGADGGLELTTLRTVLNVNVPKVLQNPGNPLFMKPAYVEIKTTDSQTSHKIVLKRF